MDGKIDRQATAYSTVNSEKFTDQTDVIVCVSHNMKVPTVCDKTKSLQNNHVHGACIIHTAIILERDRDRER